MLTRSFKSCLMATVMILPAAALQIAPVLAHAQTAQPAPKPAAAPVDEVNSQDIVVKGYREKTADSKELQATNTVTVITASDLVKTPDEDVAASLSRVAGINAINTGFSGQGNNNIGTAADLPGRGQAEYDSIRGLNAEYNINTINGVNVAQGQAYSREVQFDLLPPTGLQTIVINKTLTAAQDGEAIGGSVDFQTPNAYDFKGVDSFSMSAGLKVEGRAVDYNRDPFGGSGSVAGSHKFGSDQQFGVYAAAYVDYRNYSNSVIDGQYPAEVNGQYTFAKTDANGNSLPGLNPAKNLVLTGLDASLETGYDQRYGGNISLDWHKDANFDAYLRTTYAYETVRQDTYNVQIYGNSVSHVEDGTTGVYTPVINTLQPRYYYETGPEQAMLGTFQIGADWRSGGFHVSPNLFGSWGEDNEPNHIEFNGREPEDGPYTPFGGSVLFADTSNGPVPLVSAAEYANIANIGSYGLRRAGELSTSFSNQARGGAKIDAGYDFDNSWLHSISFGVKFESSERNHDSRDYTSNEVFTSNANDPTIASLPFISGSVSQLVPGLYKFPIPLVNQGALFNYFYADAKVNGGLNSFSDICNTGASDTPAQAFEDTYNCNTQRGIEQVTSTYAEADIFLGGVEIIPGVRYEHTGIKNDYYVLNNNTVGSFASDTSTYDKVLPSIALNYRPNPLSVYRASIWTSYVKPSMFQLGGGATESINDGTITITEGNPHLQAIDAVNYDASGEWRNTFGGYAVVALFYKTLDHFIYDSVAEYTNQTGVNAGDNVQVNTPLNGGSGDVYGLELTGRQKFTFAPGAFNGFGVAGNLTLEQSSVNTGTVGLSTHERLQDQPNTAANAQLFYEKGPVQVQLSYRYTGDYVSGYNSLGTSPATSDLDTWVKANSRLDLHASYATPWGVRLDFSAANLLNTDSFSSTIGKNVNTIPTIVNSGRTFDFTARYSF